MASGAFTPQVPASDGPGFASSAGAVAHVFAVALDDLLALGAEDGHHLQRVRRLRVGEVVTAADGAGAWRAYRIVRSDRGTIALEAAGAERREPRLDPGLVVAFALSKGPKPETVVAGLTELGVDRIVPVRTARSVVRWEGDRAEAATVRLRRVARDAAMQCRRAWLPEVDDVADLRSLLGHPAIVVGDPGGGPVADLADPPGGEWLALVGPEGGLDPDELAALDGASRVAVGPHVLRTETAALAVAAALAGRRRPVRHGA